MMKGLVIVSALLCSLSTSGVLGKDLVYGDCSDVYSQASDNCNNGCDRCFNPSGRSTNDDFDVVRHKCIADKNSDAQSRLILPYRIGSVPSGSVPRVLL